jgi:hypothetical protein
VPSLDGVMDVVVVTNSVPHGGGTLGRKVMPSLLPRLGAIGPQPVRAIARGVTTAPHRLPSVSVGMPPVGSGHYLGQSGERSAALRGQTLGLLHEGNAEVLPHLIQLLIGLWVQCVRDVL